MGVYWATYLYHGRIINREEYDRLFRVFQDIDKKQWIRKITKDMWILHAPGRIVLSGSIDPVVERFTIEYEEAFRNDSLWREKWKSCTLTNIDKLHEYCRVSSNCEPQTCVCEVELWSVGDTARISKNIPIDLSSSFCC